MDQQAIFVPVGVLAALTLFVVALIPFRRLQAEFRGSVKPGIDLSIGESANVPPTLSLANRNMMNLTEMPVLFYVGSLVLYVLTKVDALFLGMAWAYVALRVIHSAIHLTYNKFRHRSLIFGLSNLVLAALWVRLCLMLVHWVH
jgi:hypothetical protein